MTLVFRDIGPAHGSLSLSPQLLDKLIARKAGLRWGSCHFPPGERLLERGDDFGRDSGC